MPQTLIHALLAASTAQGSQQYTANYSGIASQLRSDLLSNYDKIVPPVSNRTQAIYSSGSDVELEVRFFKIETINAAEGGIRIKVWLRMLWVDERLSWDPNAYQGLTHTHFWCEGPVGGETSEIWTPDVTPYNSREGIVHSLDPAVASVDHTGAVFYSRPGALDVLCRFSGLVAFPFDNLTCTVEFGGWMYSGAVQGLTPRVTAEGLGYSFGGQESTSGSSYQEFSIVGIETVPQNFAYSSAAGAEPWPIIEYQITLQRQSDFYVVVIIVPVIITTLLVRPQCIEPRGASKPVKARRSPGHATSSGGNGRASHRTLCSLPLGSGRLTLKYSGRGGSVCWLRLSLQLSLPFPATSGVRRLLCADRRRGCAGLRHLRDRRRHPAARRAERVPARVRRAPVGGRLHRSQLALLHARPLPGVISP